MTEGAAASGPVSPWEVLDFWFGDAAVAPDEILERYVTRWFKADPAFDRQISDRFGPAVELALAGSLDHWGKTAHGRLALIILLDQFIRNMFRGTPRAFEGDGKARSLSREGMADGADLLLEPVQRQFFYLPFLHAEDLAMQELSLSCFRRLAETAPSHQRAHFASCLQAATRYHAIIARFGRFPHRNDTLKRISSPEELVLLQ